MTVNPNDYPKYYHKILKVFDGDKAEAEAFLEKHGNNLDEFVNLYRDTELKHKILKSYKPKARPNRVNRTRTTYDDDDIIIDGSKFSNGDTIVMNFDEFMEEREAEKESRRNGRRR